MNAVVQAARRAVVARRKVALGVMVLVLLWSVSELINLGRVHTIGPEIYGVLVAAVAVGTSAISLVLLAFNRTRLVATAAVLVLWGFIALGGIGGTVAHIVGPEEGHGSVDPRPRPVAAPLVFTVLGTIGGAALLLGQRLGPARVRELVAADVKTREVFPWLKQR